MGTAFSRRGIRTASVAWKGPVDTEEERKAMPEDVARKFEEMKKAARWIGSATRRRCRGPRALRNF
jgi:hypothetical protein